MSDVDFHVTDDALEEIANIALSKQTGARGLRSILENMLMEVSVWVDGRIGARGQGEDRFTVQSHQPY